MVAISAVLKLAPQVGLEPTTLGLTAECSTIELLRNSAANALDRSSDLHDLGCKAVCGEDASRQHRALRKLHQPVGVVFQEEVNEVRADGPPTTGDSLGTSPQSLRAVH